MNQFSKEFLPGLLGSVGMQPCRYERGTRKGRIECFPRIHMKSGLVGIHDGLARSGSCWVKIERWGIDVTERERIDQEAFDRGVQELLTVPLEQLRMSDNAWQKFDKPIPCRNAYVYSIQFSGEIYGKRIWDYGCGDGSLSVILAKRGGMVWGFDTSGISIEVAKRRVAANGVEGNVHFEQMSAYKLGYDDESFDLVVGLDILHRVEIGRAAKEILRVLKKGGKAEFQEPLSPVKNFSFFPDSTAS